VKSIRTTNRFLRDLRLARRRGRNIAKMEAVIETLARGERLSPRHRPHRLQGEMQGLWECHVEPDWLLVWDEDEREIVLIRCGTHADLFM
jgi:mRNA interferase YafQ